MTHPFNNKHLPFFLTAPSPCPYLPGRRERKIFTKLELGDGPELNDALTHAGFRRSQSILYRPACELCSACKSARLPVNEFEWTKSHRRVLKRNQDVHGEVSTPIATMEQYDLLSRYLNARHKEGDMAGMDFYDYASMIEDGAQRTDVVEYRRADKTLIAAVLIDNLKDGFSMVYSFFDPNEDKRSLGRFMILDQILHAKAQQLPFIYLGYWVQGSAKMAYKAQYKPIEILEPAGWRRLRDEERLEKEPPTIE
ncbi:arginyltransferase [Woodsholea maritima]|uniref:arginyltransferase n=1 Tax=Woodsholea maritima TaxID=240237 RepID=UPI000382EFCF|nr:arginyltransferase [Woodsholea maritima]